MTYTLRPTTENSDLSFVKHSEFHLNPDQFEDIKFYCNNTVIGFSYGDDYVIIHHISEREQQIQVYENKDLNDDPYVWTNQSDDEFFNFVSKILSKAEETSFKVDVKTYLTSKQIQENFKMNFLMNNLNNMMLG